MKKKAYRIKEKSSGQHVLSICPYVRESTFLKILGEVIRGQTNQNYSNEGDVDSIEMVTKNVKYYNLQYAIKIVHCASDLRV